MIQIIRHQAIKMKQLIQKMFSNLKTIRLTHKTQQMTALLKMKMDKIIHQIILQKIKTLLKTLPIALANRTKQKSKIRLVKIIINHKALKIIQSIRLRIRQTMQIINKIKMKLIVISKTKLTLPAMLQTILKLNQIRLIIIIFQVNQIKPILIILQVKLTKLILIILRMTNKKMTQIIICILERLWQLQRLEQELPIFSKKEVSVMTFKSKQIKKIRKLSNQNQLINKTMKKKHEESV